MQQPDERKRALEEDGFVTIPGFLSGERFEEILALVERYVTEVVPSLPPEQAFYQQDGKPETLKQIENMEEYEPLRRWMYSGPFHDVATSLLGDPVHCNGIEWFNKPPASDHPTPPHQDNFYFSKQPPDVITLWLALDPVDEENGCLRYVPGSHREGSRQHQKTSILGFSQGIDGYDQQDQETPVVLNPGDLVIHHCEVIHRADVNRSTRRHRRSLALVYQGANVKLDPVQWSVYRNQRKALYDEIGLDSEHDSQRQ
ncbi:MAG: phytanoyl-CoA dioxygenase [Planctomycetaceae bacterium]|nr:phytanoyl-CoA dioxygenase [Planctomycetaceae bacterium]